MASNNGDVVRRPGVLNQGAIGSHPLWQLWERILPCLFQSLGAPGNLWGSLAHRYITPAAISSLRPSPLCLRVSVCSLLSKTPVISFRIYPYPGWLQVITSLLQMYYSNISKNCYILGFWVDMVLEGMLFTPRQMETGLFCLNIGSEICRIYTSTIYIYIFVLHTHTHTHGGRLYFPTNA